MPLWLSSRNGSIRRRLGDSRAQARMWPSPIIVSDPRPQASPQVLLVQRDQEIQTFSPHGPDEPFAIGIRLRCPDWSAYDPQPKRVPQFLVQVRGKDRVAVVNQEPVRVIARDGLPQLLRVPTRFPLGINTESRLNTHIN